jgi:hypothetical protein
MSKRNVMISYERLPEITRAELRKLYPDGFQNHLKTITDFKEQTVHVLKHETSDSVYLIKMENVKAAIVNYLNNEDLQSID